MAINLPDYRQQRAAQDATSSHVVNKMFDQGVDYLIPNTKKSWEIRFLPARDPQLKNTPQYEESVVPYRYEPTQEELAAGLPAGFSNWMLPIRYYNYYGPNNLLLLSPLSMVAGQYPQASTMEERDPIYDVQQKARFSKDERVDWYELTNSPTNSFKDPAVLQRFRNAYIVSAAWREIEAGKNHEWSVGLVVLSEMGFNRTIEALNEKRAEDDEMIGNPAFRRYMLNDVTDPVHGLRGILSTVELVTETGAKMKTPMVSFTANKDSLAGHTKLPLAQITVTRNGSRVSALKARYDITASISCLDYMSLLEQLVQNPEIPMDLIHAACGPHIGYANIPERKVGTNAPASQAASTQPATQKPANYDVGMGDLPMGNSTPAAQTAAPAATTPPPAAPPPAAPPPPAPTPTVELVIDPKLKSLHYIVKEAQEGPFDTSKPEEIKTKLLGVLKAAGLADKGLTTEALEQAWFFSPDADKNEWMKASAIGVTLREKPAATPPPPPAAPAAPALPPTPPAQPEQPAAPAAATDEDKLVAEYRALEKRAQDASVSSAPVLTPEEVERMMYLSQVLGSKVD